MRGVLKILFGAALFLSLVPVHAEIRMIQEMPEVDSKPKISVPNPTTSSEPKDVSEAAPMGADLLQFLNGDLLHGKLQSIDLQSGVRWLSPDASQVIEFKPGNIDQIKLHKIKPPSQEIKNPCLVRLTNGDELRGGLLSLDPEKLHLETWYAGKIALQRNMVQAILPAQQSASSLYEGPTGMEGWTSPRGQSGWKYAKGTFFSSRPGSIGRDFKLPPMSSVEFDLGWRGQLQMVVAFYTDNLENGYGSNCYMLNIGAGFLYLSHMAQNGGGSNQIGQAQAQFLNQKNKARFGIRSNNELGTISMMVDGVVVQQWKDPRGFEGKGGGVIFTSQGQGLLRLSNVRISEWDGKFEDQVAASGKSKEDTVLLVNNDKVSGTLQNIKESKISFATSYATVNIPIERVAQIEMAGEKAEQAKRNRGDVRLTFSDGGAMTFQLEKWEGQSVTGRSPNFGEVKISTDAFQGLQFNPYREKTASESAFPSEDEQMEDNGE